MPSLAGEIDDVLNAVTKGDLDAIQAYLNVARLVGSVTITADALESEAGPETAPAEIVTTAGGGFVVFLLIAGLIPLVMIAVVLAGAQKTIGGIAIVGGPVGGMLGFVVSWLRTLIRHAAEAIESDAMHLWRLMRTIFHLWLRFEDVPTRTEVRTSANHEYRHFTRWLNHLQTDIAGINTDLYHGEHSLRKEVRAASKDLTYLNHEMSRLWGELNSLHVPNVHGLEVQMKHVTTELYKLGNEIRTLQHEVHQPLPHSPVTLPRIEHDEKRISEVETIMQRLTHEVQQLQRHTSPGHGLSHQQASELGYSHWVAVQLAPLIALAPFGGSWIRNAQRLRECDPCKAGIPIGSGGIVDGIVADLVLKDGI